MSLAEIFGSVPVFTTGTNYETAVNQLFARFNDQWNANAGAIAGYVPEIQWQGAEKDDRPDPDKFWVRVANKTISERPITLRGTDGTRYETIGMVTVELHCPKTESGITVGRQLARLARDIYKGKRLSAFVSIIRTELRELDNKREADYLFLTLTRYRYFEVT